MKRPILAERDFYFNFRATCGFWSSIALLQSVRKPVPQNEEMYVNLYEYIGDHPSAQMIARVLGFDEHCFRSKFI